MESTQAPETTGFPRRTGSNGSVESTNIILGLLLAVVVVVVACGIYVRFFRKTSTIKCENWRMRCWEHHDTDASSRSSETETDGTSDKSRGVFKKQRTSLRDHTVKMEVNAMFTNKTSRSDLGSVRHLCKTAANATRTENAVPDSSARSSTIPQYSVALAVPDDDQVTSCIDDPRYDMPVANNNLGYRLQQELQGAPSGSDVKNPAYLVPQPEYAAIGVNTTSAIIVNDSSAQSSTDFHEYEYAPVNAENQHLDPHPKFVGQQGGNAK